MNDFVFKPKNQFSQKERSRLCEIAKGVFVLAFLVFITLYGTQAWADDYYWTGASTTDPTAWNEAENWSTDDPTTATPPFAVATSAPGSGDTATFNDSNTHSFSETITVDKITVASGVILEFIGTVAVGEIENNGTLKINSASNVTILSITNSGTVENIGAGALTITTLTMATDCEVKNSVPNASPRTTGQIVIETLSGNTATTATLNSVNGQNIVVNTFDSSPKIATNGLNILLNGGTISSLETASGSIVGLQGDLEVDSDFTNSGSVISFGGTSYSITVNGNLVNNDKLGDSGSNRELSALTVTGTTTTTGSILTTGNQTYTGAVTNSGTITVPADATLTLGASFDSSSGTFTTATNAAIVVNGDGDITINTGTNALEVASFTYEPATANASNGLTITNSAITNSLGNFTASANTGNATVNIDCQSTFSTFTAESLAELTLDEANTFNGGFTFRKGGSLTVNAEQKFTSSGTLALSGTDESNPLTVDGTGQFNLPSEQQAKYLVVGTNVKICDSAGTDLASGTYLCKALRSKFSDSATGIKNGWCIVGDTITWTGGAGTTAWSEPNNWDFKIVPGLDNSGSGGEDMTGYDVVIPIDYEDDSGSSITVTQFPIAEAEYTIKNLTICGKYDSGAKTFEGLGVSVTSMDVSGVPLLTLSSANNISVTDTLTNYGRIVYSNGGRIVKGATQINDTVNEGAVEYRDGATAITEYGATDYYNLIVDSTVASIISGGDIVVSNNAKISGTASGISSFTVEKETEFEGATFTAIGAQIYKGKVKVVASANSSTISSTASDILFKDIITTENSVFTVNATSGNIEFDKTITASNSDLKFAAVDITLKDDINSDSKVTVTNSGLFLTVIGKNIDFANNGSFEQDGTGSSKLGGGITTNTSGNGNITFATDVYVYGNADSTFGGGTGTFTTSGSLHIASSATKTTASKLVAKNVLLYAGTLATNAVLETTGDLILLGAKYNIDDAGANQSGVLNLFAYNHTAREGTTHAAPSYTGNLPPIFPGDTDAISSYSGVMNVGADITIGKNFYANGIEISNGGVWTLKIPDNDSQALAFAEMYNSSISNCTVATSGSGTAYVAAAENCNVSNCTGIETKRMVIANAKMIYDNTLEVTFKYDDGTPVVIENSNNEINRVASNLKLGGNVAISVYTDEDCTTSVSATDDYGNGVDDAILYFKAAIPWNTDATGVSAGSDDSTDRQGNKSKTIPYLNIPKALDTLYESLRDKYKNRISHYYNDSPSVGLGAIMSDTVGQTYTKIEDECGPVLVAVYVGIEPHINGASQPEYDGHNFIEFRYSEPVVISDGLNTIKNDDINIRATSTLGEITNSGSGFSIAGFGSIAAGNISASLKFGSGSVHAVYRKFGLLQSDTPKEQPCRVRVSVAGYVEGTVGGGYKNWVAYIESAVSPSGDFTRIANTNIKDFAQKLDGTPINNILDSTGTTIHPTPTIVVNAKAADSALYRAWDTTPPSFAPKRINGEMSWANPATDGSQEYELIGHSYTGGMISAIELHLFDNKPAYNTTEYQWFSRIGWAKAKASSPMEYDDSGVLSKAADVLGGIRYCSVFDSNDNNAFTYSSSVHPEYKNCSKVEQGALSYFFTPVDGIGNAIDENDGHYLKLYLDSSDTTLTPETTFSVKFDSTKCFITDLAGNRIQSGAITMKSVDRASPAIALSAAPLGGNKLLVVFSKSLNLDYVRWCDTASSEPRFIPVLDNIQKSLVLTDDSGTNINIDEKVPAKCAFKTSRSTGLIFTLTKAAVLKDITGGVFIKIKNVENAYDPLSGTIGEVTYIQDDLGNYMKAGEKHAFSDFAIDAVQMQYAYAVLEEGLDDETKFDMERGTFVVRNWDAEQGRESYINEKQEIVLHAALYDGTGNNSGGINGTNGLRERLASGEKVTVYFDDNPESGSVSDKINFFMSPAKSWRIWTPKFFGNIAYKANTPDVAVDGTVGKGSMLDNRMFVNFDVPKEASVANWEDGDQVKFLFKLGDYTVDHNGDGVLHPLYCLRLADSTDITSLDLWSFKMKSVKLQRGGVTILNNVINVNENQKTTVRVDLESSGNLSVMVMTIDGNIVKYLHHGQASAGSHYYVWDGRNNGGNPVARGLYFVRVIGSGIDETRKVMCIKK